MSAADDVRRLAAQEFVARHEAALGAERLADTAEAAGFTRIWDYLESLVNPPEDPS